jgi:F0F1-type ATP synthase membrane subunit c/vacuolar-type H+-ATPase subunit K
VRSSTDTWADAVRDTGHLIGFRARTVRRRTGAVVGVVVVLALTAMFASVPASLEAHGQLGDILDTLVDSLSGNVGSALLGTLLLSIASSMSSGGGRELLSRSEASIHPVSARTEHLGSLALAPLNLAWLIQLWGLMTVVALVAPPGRLLGAQIAVVAWILASTAFGQAVGWAVEGVRRTPHGVLAVRTGGVVVAVVVGALHLAGLLTPMVDAFPTTVLADLMLEGPSYVVALGLVVVFVLVVRVGALPAAWALGLPPREELRVQSGVHEARHAPEPRWGSPERALLRRLDRGSVWRSIGMRRGLIVLGTGPGLIALTAGLQWNTVMILPGLTASGAALLFAVNAWCLDAKGMIWRETLPVAAADVFAARTRVIAESMVAVSGITVLLALVRNGLPDLVTGLAVLACWAVVVVQVLAIAMTWSMRSPHAVDLSSPRATPAPHASMAAYAGKLSLVTTLTSMLFTGVAVTPWAWLPPAVAVPFLAYSAWKLVRARRRWLAPAERARVVLTVAAV